ncbi:di-N-acetylchitobiase [Biomphalaria pfeifferi]|uniref:Di-N-acetylchitobiase n=1 Tax=Biomphalaria pfeifferi TaxID=112525 RepID=A0AAD8BIG1_BIOPF|nr:di-N-acetylchitobiase [Biomphalaria pfeifferi]
MDCCTFSLFGSLILQLLLLSGLSSTSYISKFSVDDVALSSVPNELVLDLKPEVADCPCDDPAWCMPLTDTPEKEVFAFSIRSDTSHWERFDWSKLTTVVVFGYLNDSLTCLAHSHNVRVIMLGDVSVQTFTDAAKRQQWIQTQLLLVQKHFLDGINFDFEGQVGLNDTLIRDSYTTLVKETTQVFKKVLPSYQISVDVGWKPNVDIRYFDYQGLADAADLLFVMAYDEQSQILGECLAGPNSALASAGVGLDAYLNGYNISASKLILGVPWYGYIYECTELVGDNCYIKEVPFRGVNCSDAAGTQYDYGPLHELIQTMPENYKWNATSLTPYITYTNAQSGKSYQVQFDDPESLKLKYDLAAQKGIKGVGMWNIDSLDFSDTEVGESIRRVMFDALPPRTAVDKTIGQRVDRTREVTQGGALLSVKPAKKMRSTVVEEISVDDASVNDIADAVDLLSEISSPLDSSRLKRLCPCDNPKWCEPIKDTKRKEVYAFSIVNNETNWSKFDWTRITTVCMYGFFNPKLMCLAHSYNVRVVTLGAVDLITMITPELRYKWVLNQLQNVVDNFMDGLNFDVEMNISPEHKELRDAYTALVNETVVAFKQALPYSQISIDVQGDAFTTSRSYDYPTLAKLVDFLFIMAYDESGFDVAGPNSGVLDTVTGVIDYFQEKISPDKLVLGLPWYGYIYFCDKLVGDVCEISPTRAQQLDFNTISAILETMPEKYRWNTTSETPYFSYTDSETNISRQVQFDDAASLKIKYELAADLGLRGVGMWTIDFLDYTDTQRGQAMRTAMFGALPTHS